LRGQGRAITLILSLESIGGRKLFFAEQPMGQAETVFTLPLEEVPVGRWLVQVEAREKGVVTASRTLTLLKLPPAPAGVNETKLDHENRCLLKNGEPFFPVGICAEHVSPPWLDLYKDIGFNTVILWQGEGQARSVATGVEQLNDIHARNLVAIPRPLTWASGGMEAVRGSSDALLMAVEELRTKLDPIRHHPSVLMYYTIDEPGGGITMGLEGFVNLLREVDPYHPVLLGDGTTSADDRYTVADVHGRFPYWCPMGAPPFDTPNVISRCVKWNVENNSEPNQRPFFHIPQCEITSFSRRGFTPDERRISVYLGLVQGAKSVIYFVSPIRHRASAESMKQLSAEIAALAPALLKRRVPQEITVTPSPPFAMGEPDSFEKPGSNVHDLPIVQSLFADRPEGGSFLIAANSSHAPVETTWDLSQLGSGTRVRVSDFFADKLLAVQNGVLKDRFGRYATRVYLIEGAERQPGGTVRIHATFEGPALAVAGEPEPLAPPKFGKNLLINSSFEDATLPRLAGFLVVPGSIRPADGG